MALLAEDYNPITLLTTEGGRRSLWALNRGRHVLYGWWNYLAQFLFGPHYYSAVFMNVALTFVAAALLYRICRLSGFSRRYAQGLAGFFLLHWDVVAWSSFVNLKDVAILTLSTAAIYSLLLFNAAVSRRERLFRAAVVAGVFFTFLWIRFYIPVLISGAFVGWLLLKQRGWRKYTALALTFGAVFLILPSRVETEYVRASPLGVLYGSVRYLLTPRPWGIEHDSSFLLLPSILHWLFFLPSAVGAVFLWRRSRAAALLLLYLGVSILFYSIVPSLQGPRHRVQTTFIWAWIQYHFLFLLFRNVSHSQRRPGDRPVFASERAWEGTVR